MKPGEGAEYHIDKQTDKIYRRVSSPLHDSFGGLVGRIECIHDVTTLYEAEERIRTIAAPQNVARHPGFRTPCARTGVCSDCNSPDRVCNTRMEMLRCWPAGRVLVVLIDQELGL